MGETDELLGGVCVNTRTILADTTIYALIRYSIESHLHRFSPYLKAFGFHSFYLLLALRVSPHSHYI